MKRYFVSTPSRICLAGEHQDYLGLEVITSAIDLRFNCIINKRSDNIVHLAVRNERMNKLNSENKSKLYHNFMIGLKKPIIYLNKRDYSKSVINVLIREGYDLGKGFNIILNSEIPIGKGMCSSTTMVIVLIKSILECIQHPDKDNLEKIAMLGFMAEVAEFNEPGGMMDHFASSLGGLIHLDFKDCKIKVTRLSSELDGEFILFDSLEGKNTIQGLKSCKEPVLKALSELKKYGINSIKDFVTDERNYKYLDNLDDSLKTKLNASISTHKIVIEMKTLLESGKFTSEEIGSLISRHHADLRDGLGLSTPRIELILDAAMANGALGGKINGSGGGGCGTIFAHSSDCDRIIEAITNIGYPAKRVRQCSGVSLDKIVD